MMSRILVGSRYFFSGYPGFVGKDTDEVEIIDTNEFNNMRQVTGQEKCLFQFKRKNGVDDYIRYALGSPLGMVLGKFLVPEFCEEIGFTINDLPKLKPLVKRLDDRHKYEEIIYESYIQNGDFVLTEEQRNKAYLSYKESRGLE